MCGCYNTPEGSYKCDRCEYEEIMEELAEMERQDFNQTMAEIDLEENFDWLVDMWDE